MDARDRSPAGGGASTDRREPDATLIDTLLTRRSRRVRLAAGSTAAPWHSRASRIRSR